MCTVSLCKVKYNWKEYRSFRVKVDMTCIWIFLWRQYMAKSKKRAQGRKREGTNSNPNHIHIPVMMSRRLWERELDRLKSKSKGAANQVPTCAVSIHAPQTSSLWREVEGVGSACELGGSTTKAILKPCQGVVSRTQTQVADQKRTAGTGMSHEGFLEQNVQCYYHPRGMSQRECCEQAIHRKRIFIVSWRWSNIHLAIVAISGQL